LGLFHPNSCYSEPADRPDPAEWSAFLQSQNDCHECRRLWAEYLSALLDHARLDRQVYFIRLGQEAGGLDGLEQSRETARIAKDSFRKMIRQHEQSHPH
jgi:hypothetical protein